MIKSLRWRIQVWFTALLLLVLGGFGGILYYRAWSATWHEVDTQLSGAALYLDAVLRGFPPSELDGKADGKRPPPDDKRPPPDDKWWDDGKPPPDDDKPPPKKKGPPRSKETRLAEMALPPQFERPGPPEDRLYFAVWRSDGALVKSLGLRHEPSPPDDRKLPPHPRFSDAGNRREAWMSGPHGSRILVGKQIVAEHNSLVTLGWQIAGLGAGVLVLGSLLGLALAARLVRPLAAMARGATAISATNLGERLDPARMDTELANLAGTLNDAFDRLEHAFQREQQFTADASHELRTPLAILRSHAELALSRSRTEEEYRKTLETVLRTTARMSGLVQNLLTLARADAAPGPAREAVPLDRILRECMEALEPLAAEKAVSLSVSVVPALVHGDAAGLTQIVSNLVQNAIQHNRQGGKAEATLVLEGENAVFTVADDGPGIPAADQPRIFERFYRVDKARARASGGAGLGLAICKTLVTALRGTIHVESQPGAGSRFIVKLPLASERRGSSPPDAPPSRDLFRPGDPPFADGVR